MSPKANVMLDDQANLFTQYVICRKMLKKIFRSNFTYGVVAGVMFTLLLVFMNKHSARYTTVSTTSTASRIPTAAAKHTLDKMNKTQQKEEEIEHPVVINKLAKIPGLLVQESANKQGKYLTTKLVL